VDDATESSVLVAADAVATTGEVLLLVVAPLDAVEPMMMMNKNQ
jgi:hypothetical protein